jgi:protein arginine N-methyltransferase 1
MAHPLHEHRHYLGDPWRLRAFDQALRSVVRPGDVVVDLGCGTGVLGWLALQAGAAHVYAIDESGMIDVARRLSVANGFADRVTHLALPSTDAVLPVPADVVVADQVGYLGFEAGLIRSFADARRRLLKPDGRVIPERVSTWLAPAAAPDLAEQLDFWLSRPAGFDVRAARDIMANAAHRSQLDPSTFMAPGQSVVTWQIGEEYVSGASGTVGFTMERAGTVNALAGWFDARLATDVSFTNLPGRPDTIDRPQSLLPIDPPLDALAGDRLVVTLRVRPDERVLAWDVALHRYDRLVERRRHSTWQSLLMPVEKLRDGGH